MWFDDNPAVLLNNKCKMLGMQISGVVSMDLQMKRWEKIVSLASKVSKQQSKPPLPFLTCSHTVQFTGSMIGVILNTRLISPHFPPRNLQRSVMNHNSGTWSVEAPNSCFSVAEAGHCSLGEHPVIIGKCGVPMDMNGCTAFKDQQLELAMAHDRCSDHWSGVGQHQLHVC